MGESMEKEFDVEFRVATKIKPFLKDLKRTPMDIAMDVHFFVEKQGVKALEAMEHFIDNANPSLIPATLAHDLYNCEKPCFCPKTSAY